MFAGIRPPVYRLFRQHHQHWRSDGIERPSEWRKLLQRTRRGSGSDQMPGAGAGSAHPGQHGTPGRIDTEELRQRYQLADARNKSRLEREVPLQRLGTPEEVADMILHLASAGQYITGQNFLVDGGLFMR